MKRWSSDFEEIQTGKFLSQGIRGKICRGKLYDVIDVALKFIDIEDEEPFLRESEITRHFNHPNILQTIGVCENPRIIITEFMANGNLKQYLQSNFFSPTECLSVAVKIASGMAYLASKKVAHCDLAARNILVGNDIETIKISDFGISRILDVPCTEKTNLPVDWTAPEAMKGEISLAADVWSYAVVLWEIYSDGADPYADIPDRRENMYELLTVQNLRLPCPAKCPQSAYEMMLKCWSINPKERPSFDGIHEFFVNVQSELHRTSYEERTKFINSESSDFESAVTQRG